MTPNIFINYRRGSDASAAGRVSDYLRIALPEAFVFFDVESIELGQGFPQETKKRVLDCNVFLAVIGPDWSQAFERRRLSGERDWVQFEIELALRFDKFIIPVLVNGAKMPGTKELPGMLQPLGQVNACSLSHQYFREDAQRLANQINEIAHKISIRPPIDAIALEGLGPLANLAGSWKGTGFNLVARPNFEGNANLYLELNQTEETLKFDPIGSAMRSRGVGMNDIELFGLTYLQRVNDSATGSVLHVEPGIWACQAAAPQVHPASGDDIVFRIGSVSNGSAILAKGSAHRFSGPPTLPTESATYNGSIFPSFNSTPFAVGGPIFAQGTAEFNLPPPPPPAPAHGFSQYTITNPPSAANPRTPFGNVPAVPLPAEIDGVLIQDVVNDPITLLQEVVAQQQVDGFTFEGVALNITSQTPIVFGTMPNQAAPTVTVAVPDGGGGIKNVPFLQTNADSALFYATFWITTVSHWRRRESFLQLQYAQMELLNFPLLLAADPKPNFSWPHITVGTLTSWA